ncbi:MAG TPA: hypothetical protein VFB75_11995, partial [Burkholderiales bacterium]|nr:hypothetical protein [Burkholderiales bacterium]
TPSMVASPMPAFNTLLRFIDLPPEVFLIGKTLRSHGLTRLALRRATLRRFLARLVDMNQVKENRRKIGDRRTDHVFETRKVAAAEMDARAGAGCSFALWATGAFGQDQNYA